MWGIVEQTCKNKRKNWESASGLWWLRSGRSWTFMFDRRGQRRRKARRAKGGAFQKNQKSVRKEKFYNSGTADKHATPTKQHRSGKAGRFILCCIWHQCYGISLVKASGFPPCFHREDVATSTDEVWTSLWFSLRGQLYARGHGNIQCHSCSLCHLEKINCFFFRNHWLETILTNNWLEAISIKIGNNWNNLEKKLNELIQQVIFSNTWAVPIEQSLRWKSPWRRPRKTRPSPPSNGRGSPSASRGSPGSSWCSASVGWSTGGKK